VREGENHIWKKKKKEKGEKERERMTSDHNNFNLLTIDGKPLDGAHIVAVGRDSVYVENFIPMLLGAKIKEIDAQFDDVVGVMAELTTTLPWTDPKWREMRYRGHELQRQKAFLVSSLATYPRYGYPGMQYASMQHYRLISSVPLVQRMVEQLINRCQFNGQPIRINHVIGTLYSDGDKNIGFHSDKVQDIAIASPILSLTFGGVREFHLRDATTEVVTHRLALQPGSLFVLGPRTNVAYQHSIVPIADEQLIDRDVVPVTPRISLVLRDISTLLPAEVVAAKVAASAKKKSAAAAAAVAAAAPAADGAAAAAKKKKKESKVEEKQTSSAATSSTIVERKGKRAAASMTHARGEADESGIGSGDQQLQHEATLLGRGKKQKR
jgi:alkylated DNA repair dioxygenase AlkB